MIDIITSLFISWSTIVTAVILVLVGLFKTNYRFFVAAAILALPFSWFLSRFPVIHSLGFLLPLPIYSFYFAFYRDHEMIVQLTALPFFNDIVFMLHDPGVTRLIATMESI